MVDYLLIEMKSRSPVQLCGLKHERLHDFYFKMRQKANIAIARFFAFLLTKKEITDQCCQIERFMANWTSFCLSLGEKFQISAGVIFERF